ncbi:MAG UNVERIFIED_CONTAM: hypothetical protein LVT10_09715 [Anaerolineae bacterium]
MLFRKQYNAENGDMVAIWLEDRGETTLKYFYHEGDRIRFTTGTPHHATDLCERSYVPSTRKSDLRHSYSPLEPKRVHS